MFLGLFHVEIKVTILNAARDAPFFAVIASIYIRRAPDATQNVSKPELFLLGSLKVPRPEGARVPLGAP